MIVRRSALQESRNIDGGAFKSQRVANEAKSSSERLTRASKEAALPPNSRTAAASNLFRSRAASRAHPRVAGAPVAAPLPGACRYEKSATFRPSRTRRDFC